MALFWILASAVVVYVFNISIYRLYLSPLSHIPGPRLAALTAWYEVFYDCVKPAQYVFKIQELHKKYGPIIRVDPRVVSINDISFLDQIYAPGGAQRRDKDALGSKHLDVDTSVGGAAAHDLHKKRRESLNPFFSQKSVLELATPFLDRKIAQLSSIFSEAVGEEKYLNLSDLFFALANDVVSQYSFGHNGNALADQLRASTMRNNLHKVLRKRQIQPSLLVDPEIDQKVTSIYRALLRASRYYRHDQISTVDRILNDTENTKRGFGKSIFYELKDDPSLPTEEKSAQRLVDEATLIVMAGTESTAKSMEIAHFYLLQNPLIMKHVREELRLVSNDSLTELQKLPYIAAVASEANRLPFGITGRNSRISPDFDVAYIDSALDNTYRLPAGTPMSMSTLLVHTNEKLFPDPWKFVPERWLGVEGKIRSKYLMSFGKGNRKCLGINLAHAELVSLIKEVTKWDMELDHDITEADVKFQYDFHVATPRLDSPGLRARVLRANDS